MYDILFHYNLLLKFLLQLLVYLLEAQRQTQPWIYLLYLTFQEINCQYYFQKIKAVQYNKANICEMGGKNHQMEKPVKMKELLFLQKNKREVTLRKQIYS